LSVANGTFVFATTAASGATYNVSIATSPAGQLCSVANGSGIIGSSNITNIVVSCATPSAGGGNQYGSGPDPIASPSGNPGSSDLIRAAVTAGSLTREQALLYYLYADYNDSRLPAQYRGDDTGIIEGTAHNRVVSYITEVGLANVSSTTLNALEPFFIPSYLEGSYTSSSSATAQAARTSIQSVKPQGVVKFGWSNVAGTNVVVWYETSRATTDLPMATMLVNEIDGTIWPKLTTLMGRSPKSDVGSVLWTETDGRLDITLEDLPKSKEGVTIPDSWAGKDTSVHIKLSRSLGYPGLIAQAAHEVMHAIQFSINVKASEVPKYATISEATASWASHYVYPKNDWETKYAQYYLKGTQLGNAYDNPANTNNADNENFRYGAYVFPLFLETTLSASIVKDIWDKTVSESLELDAINQAIKGKGSTFADQWRKFIPWAWNQDTLNDLTRLYAASSVTFTTRPDNRAVDLEQDYSLAVTNGFGGASHAVDLPRASMAFYRVTFAGTNSRSVTFLNGLTYKLDTYDDHGVGTMFRFTGEIPDNLQGASVQLYLKVNGAWQSAAVDMTNIAWYSVCRDNPAGKIEEMIFMYGNAEVDRSKPNYTSLHARGDLEPGLAATDIACRDWTGSLSMSRPTTQGVGTETFKLNNVTLTNAMDSSAPTPALQAPGYLLAPGDSVQPPFGFVYRVSGGTAVWSYSAHQSAPADVCDWTGNESTPIAGMIPLVTFSNFAPPGNTFRSVIITPLSTNQLFTLVTWKANWTCTSSNGTRTQGTLTGSAPSMDIVVDQLNQAVRIKNNGTSMNGTGAQTSSFMSYGDVTGTWSFTAVP
jgi:hypothetical protein